MGSPFSSNRTKCNPIKLFPLVFEPTGILVGSKTKDSIKMFPLVFEPTGISVGSKTKGILSIKSHCAPFDAKQNAIQSRVEACHATKGTSGSWQHKPNLIAFTIYLSIRNQTLRSVVPIGTKRHAVCFYYEPNAM